MSPSTTRCCFCCSMSPSTTPKTLMDGRKMTYIGFFCILLFFVVAIIVTGIIEKGKDNELHFSVAPDATLARFAAYAAGNATAATLSYDLRAALLLRNPPLDSAVTYDFLAASYYFNGTQFVGRAIEPFLQDSGNITVLRMDVAGTTEGAGPALLAEFERCNRTGVFDLQLQLDCLYHTSPKDPTQITVRCPLALRLGSPAAAAAADCELDVGF